MKNIIYKISIVCTITLIGLSCSNIEDELAQVNPNETTTDTFFLNLGDTQTALNATYSVLLDQSIYMVNQEAVRADMGWPGYGRPAPSGKGPVDWYFKTFNSSTPGVIDKWKNLYRGVFRANQVIEALENLKDSVDEDGRVQQLAQARFLRGLYHFYLHTAYNKGSIIIRDKTVSDPEKFNKALSSSEEVKTFFRDDLIYAYTNLPRNYGSGHLGKVTKGAAASVLGTSYLYDENYQEAIVYFDDIIDRGPYALVSGGDVSTLMFTTAGEFNSESILEVVYSQDLRLEFTTSGGVDILQNRLNREATSVSGAMVPAWLAYAYKTEPMDPLDARNFTDAFGVPTTTMRNVPLRASSMVGLVEDEQTLYYIEDIYAQKGKIAIKGLGFSQYKKYTNHDIFTSNNEIELPGGNTRSGKNFTIIRLAEVLLMKAECLIKTNDIDGALDLINQVRDRWGLVLLGPANGDTESTYDEMVYTEDALMDHLMYVEKPLELSSEGNSMRWTDLRRWGVIEQRFNDLASQTFYAVDYTAVRVNGKNKKKTKSSIVADNPVGAKVTIDYEYDQSAANYIPELHDYLPIPLSETNANTEL